MFKMKEIYNGILGSFDNEQKGFSSRKLTAFALIVMVIITHVKWLMMGDFTQLELVLSIDYAFIASLFGMVTYQGIKNKKLEKNEPVVDPAPDVNKQ